MNPDWALAFCAWAAVLAGAATAFIRGRPILGAALLGLWVLVPVVAAGAWLFLMSWFLSNAPS